MSMGTSHLLKCHRHQRAKKGRGTKNETRNSLPQKSSETCSFYVPTFYDNTHDCMFVRKNSGCNFEHNGHLPVQREHMKLGKTALTTEHLDLAEKMMGQNTPTSIVDVMLSILSGNRISEDALQKIRRGVLLAKHGNTGNESTAQVLLRMLENKDGVIFCYMTASYSEATKLVRVRKVKKKKKRAKRKKRGRQDDTEQGDQPNEQPDLLPPLHDNGPDADETIETVETSNDKETNRYVKAVINALSLGNGEILLAIAFVTGEGRKYHKKFPRVLGFDVKYGTNNEKRPMGRAVGRHNNKRNLPTMNCYLPSQQEYVFAWVFSEAIPYCLDKEALKRTSIIPTDDDQQEINALNNILSKSDCPYGQEARGRSCKWHKVSTYTHMSVFTYARIRIRSYIKSYTCFCY